MTILSLAVTLLAYAILLPSVIGTMDVYAELRLKHPMHSLDERMPVLPKASSVKPQYDPDRLNQLEEEVANATNYWNVPESAALKRLHENSVDLFIDSWGFGVGRMHPDDPLWLTRFNMIEHQSPPQPVIPTYSSSETSALPSIQFETLNTIHGNGLIDFLNPNGFGYYKDHQHVVGFKPHAFSKQPHIGDRTEMVKPVGWEVARLELVSLLMHKEPSVYLSDRLPQMDALKGVPTRPLDAFETEGLANLRKGDDLFVRNERMLGSIRSTKQCIACHGGERGQLLGAFTYTLRPSQK